MILNCNLDKIRTEVKSAINELFAIALENQKRENDFILFLANCSANKKENQVHLLCTLDDLWFGGDHNRKNFINFYKVLCQNVKKNEREIDSMLDKNMLYLEMMIYSQIWESKPNLKKLHQLSEISQSNDYPWFLEIPEMAKHDFIRIQTRDKFPNSCNLIKTVIRESYNSQIRNAFAHSDFSFVQDDIVVLNNHKPESGWTSEALPVSLVEQKVMKSILLFEELEYKIRVTIEESTKSNKRFQVFCPDDDGLLNPTIILYDEIERVFRWE